MDNHGREGRDSVLASLMVVHRLGIVVGDSISLLERPFLRPDPLPMKQQ